MTLKTKQISSAINKNQSWKKNQADLLCQWQRTSDGHKDALKRRLDEVVQHVKNKDKGNSGTDDKAKGFRKQLEPIMAQENEALLYLHTHRQDIMSPVTQT